jgi:hypothetical protein
MERAKAIGRRGSWFAKVNGERLPCVHQHWFTGVEYDDPFYQEGLEPWPEFVEAIKAGGKVVVTRDEVTVKADGKPPAFKRSGYVAVYRVSDVRIEGSHLRFRRYGLRELELE